MRTCEWGDCPKAARPRRRMCTMHLGRLSRGTDMDAPERIIGDHETRFWSKVTIAGPDDCWPWTGASLNEAGYGQFALNGRPHRAHRIAWALTNGPIPSGMVLDHLCRRRDCVNPVHLEVVTNEENIARGYFFNVRPAAKTHCRNGHEFTADNTRIAPRGYRRCRTCERAQSLAGYYRRKEATA